MNRRLAGLLGTLGLVLLLGWYLRDRSRIRPDVGGRMTSAAAEAVARDYLAIEEREQAAARQIWAEEVEAGRHEDEVLRWWDALNAVTNAWSVLKDIPVTQAAWPVPGPPEALPHGITRSVGDAAARQSLDAAGWSAQLAAWARSGWSWRGSHWAMVGHEPASAGRPARSVIRLRVRLERESPRERAILRVRLRVTWRPDLSGLEDALVEHLEWLHRAGEPPFRLWMEAELAPDAGQFQDPLIVRDLDGDGRPEILLVGAGEQWRNRTASGDAATQFLRETMAGVPRERIQAAVMTDADGDGREDLILAGAGGVRWMSGSNSWSAAEARSGWSAPEPLKHPQAIAAGDVDADGDTDLWVIQYKLPYQQGQFPTPWWDARDGFPAHLLLNDGTGRFADATPAAGLDPVRRRRSYSASLLDLDGDRDLDLVNVSDFSGLDVFVNDGRGRFRDAGRDLGAARHAFGMAHVFQDANGDARPDLLMLGMDSPVAERLEGLGLRRLAPGEPAGMVRAMTRGNRLYFGAASGDAPLVPAAETADRALASTGWTWGAAWEDFDLDGRLDLAVANGHETRASVADYERQFWRHDRFAAGSDPNPAAKLYFQTAAGRRQAAGASYGGWQDNQFLLQLGAGEFAEVAWLLGLAVPMDCRNLVAADLDLDGRPDLVLTTQEGWPQPRQRLLVYRNGLEPRGGWIGLRFTGAAPSGTMVALEMRDGTRSRWRTTGDGFRSQGPAGVHFGLGDDIPLRARIRWGAEKPDTVIESPAVHRWHAVPVP